MATRGAMTTAMARGVPGTTMGLYPPNGTGAGYVNDQGDKEYRTRYLVEVDTLFGDHRKVAPTVIGEEAS